MSWWCDFVAGWLGGSAGIVIGHPFDTIKTVQQVLPCSVYLTLPQAGAGRRSLLLTARTLYTTEGVRRGFFKGMLYPVVSNGAINSIFFGIYGALLPRIQVIGKTAIGQ
jgi:hypothetical protein